MLIHENQSLIRNRIKKYPGQKVLKFFRDLGLRTIYIDILYQKHSINCIVSKFYRQHFSPYKYVSTCLIAVNYRELLEDLSKPEIEGIYETQMSLEFRAILQLGCVCTVDSKAARTLADGSDTFTLDQLDFKSIAVQPYLKNVMTSWFISSADYNRNGFIFTLF